MPKKPRATQPLPSSAPAELLREYGPFVRDEPVHGVSYDGEQVWFATGSTLRALDPARGTLTQALDVVCDAGTAFDGTYLFQLGDKSIQKIDPRTGSVLHRVPSPGEGRDAGLTWYDGKLWVAKHDAHTIYQIDPDTGAILHSVETGRFVTGVTWVDDELWHGTLEDGVSELRRIAPDTGAVLTRLSLPAGVHVSGLESDGAGVLYCGGARSGKVRAVRRPRR